MSHSHYFWGEIGGMLSMSLLYDGGKQVDEFDRRYVMFALVSPQKVELPPGAVVRLPATWEQYQMLCQQRGDESIPRLKYRIGEVLLMSPLPQHGRDAH